MFLLKLSIFLSVLIGHLECPVWAKPLPPKIGVGIPPLHYVLKKTLPESLHSNLFILIPSHQDPHHYEPTPTQMKALSELTLYFNLQLTQEKAWLSKKQPHLGFLKIIDLSSFAPKNDPKKMHDEHLENPHIWNNPLILLNLAQEMARVLTDVFPDLKEDIEKRSLSLQKELKTLDSELEQLLSTLKNRNFIVYHPSWSYFAARYHLKEVPIEMHGKEAGTKRLAELIQFAQKNHIKKVFIQKQFNPKQVEVFAKSINAQIIQVDDFSEKYSENLKNFALELTKETL